MYASCSSFRFISVTALYLLLGFLYNRFVLGAKGKDQIPNYEFWQDLGNLEAVSIIVSCVIIISHVCFKKRPHIHQHMAI